MSAAEDDAARPKEEQVVVEQRAVDDPLPPSAHEWSAELTALRFEAVLKLPFATRLSMDSSEVGGAELARLTQRAGQLQHAVLGRRRTVSHHA